MRNDVELTTVAGQLYESQATVVRSPSYDEAEPAIYITTRLLLQAVITDVFLGRLASYPKEHPKFLNGGV